jgi:hypothetical protein
MTYVADPETRPNVRIEGDSVVVVLEGTREPPLEVELTDWQAWQLQSSLRKLLAHSASSHVCPDCGGLGAPTHPCPETGLLSSCCPDCEKL